VDELLASLTMANAWRCPGSIWRVMPTPGYTSTSAPYVAVADWLIRSFNQNLPYDEFIVEQIAGDLMPNATQDQKIGPASTAIT